jgi:2-keto-4-pentenoate hydratase
MDAEAISQAAARIVAARDRRAVLGPLPAACRPAGEADGYAVQEAVHRRLAEAGRGEPAGWKLGCTTPVMQDLVGVEGATYGAMAATGLYHGDRSFRLAAFRRPGVECEIAVRLDRRLGPDGAPFDRGAVAGAVGACMVAAEVVDDRYSDFKSIGAPTLIADDFFHAAAVLGRGKNHRRSGSAMIFSTPPPCWGVRWRTGAGSISLPSRAARWSTAARPAAASAPTRSATRWTRWPGWPIGWPPAAAACAPERWC